jgi:predicted  nucleic acid-binding Zn-ribbon protein
MFFRSPQVAELQGEVEAKDEEMAELKAKHERVLARMKRDQSALLEKVRELEEALEDL